MTVVATSLLLILLLGSHHISQVRGCSPPHATPHGPWIGGFGWSNPLITTDQEGILISNLVVYLYRYDGDDNDHQSGSSTLETNIVINASTGSVQRRTEDDDNFVLTPNANKTTNIDGGWDIDNVEVAEDLQTALVQLSSAYDPTQTIEFTIQAPDSSGFRTQDSATSTDCCPYYRVFISEKLNIAYITYSHYINYISHYVVIDLLAEYNSSSLLQLQEFPPGYLLDAFDHPTWGPEKYEDLQVLSVWDRSSCYFRTHLHYNETHLTQARGMEHHTYTRSIDYGDTVEENTYYSLTKHIESIDIDVEPTNDDDWYYPSLNWIVSNYTLWHKNLVSGDVLGEVMVNMEDIHRIADGLINGTNDDTTTTTITNRQSLRNSANTTTTQDKSTTQDLTTIHIQASLVFDFFQGQGKEPTSDDLGSCIAATQEFFRQTLEHKKPNSIVDFTISNVVPRTDSDTSSSSNPDRFNLDFVSSIVHEGNALTARQAADIMGHADFKQYIGHFLRSSPSSAFHSTFKVFFKGIGKS